MDNFFPSHLHFPLYFPRYDKYRKASHKHITFTLHPGEIDSEWNPTRNLSTAEINTWKNRKMIIRTRDDNTMVLKKFTSPQNVPFNNTKSKAGEIDAQQQLLPSDLL